MEDLEELLRDVGDRGKLGGGQTDQETCSDPLSGDKVNYILRDITCHHQTSQDTCRPHGPVLLVEQLVRLVL